MHIIHTRLILKNLFLIFLGILVLHENPSLSSKIFGVWDRSVIDFFQFWLTLISLVILILSVYRHYERNSLVNYWALSWAISLNTLLVLILIGTFKIFLFFIIFEISVIPIFIIILGWGYQPEKLKAAYALFFFTALLAAPLLLRRIYFYSQRYNLLGPIWEPRINTNFYSAGQSVIFLTGFLVKLPIYGLHMWLPLAHVEAPVYGSIILAGILLKLGGIGLLRFRLFLSEFKSTNWIILISLVGIGLVGITCLFLTDLKKIIAFSSVGHMAFSVIFLSLKLKSSVIIGSLILLVHAFRSSGLFFIVYIFYLRSNSRNLVLNIGILRVQPIMRFFWLIIIIARLGGPPAINLLAEIWALLLTLIFLPKYILILFARFILTSVYHFILYRRLIQGATLWDRRKFIVKFRHVGIYLVAIFHVVYTITTVFLIRAFLV